MKYKYLLLATGLLWGTSTVNAQWRSASEAPVRQQPEISKTVKNQGDGKVLYSYCSSIAAVTAKSGLGIQTDDDVKVTAAIRMSEGLMTLLKGRNIHRLRVGVATDAEDATVFIRKTDGTAIWQINKALELGWNDITLETPLVVPEEQELYIGYTCTQRNGVFVIATELGNTTKLNGLFMASEYYPYLEDFSGSADLGNLCLSVEVDGTESEFGCLGSMVKAYSSKPYLQEGANKSTEMNIIYANEGENNVSKIKLGRKFNGTELGDTICYFKRTVRGNSTGELELPVTSSMSGKYTYTLKEIEGNPVSVSPVTASVSTYKAEDVIERVALIEEFTSQSCGNCPAAQANLHRTIADKEDRVALVLHHSGFKPDDFSIPESDGYCYFYKPAGTFAPGMTMDRTYLPDYDTQGTGSMVFNPKLLSKSTLTKELALPSMVSVGIDCSYDKADRKLVVIVSGNKITDLIGEHVGLTVFLLENKYIARQLGVGDPDNFEHNNILRAVLSDPMGDVITFNADGTYSRRYDYTVPASYVSTTGARTKAFPENMNIVAFVSNFDAVYPDNCCVLNANKTASLNVGDTGLKAENVLKKAFPVFAKDGTVHAYGEYSDLKVYNLQGMPVPNENLEPGVYIVRITGQDRKEHVRKVLVRN